MIVLIFEVVKQTVSQKNFEKLVNDSSNYVKLCFDFKDPDWSDVCKRILFHSSSSETYCKELDENHEVIVPWEVLTEDYFVFNLYGVGDGSLRITTTPKKVSLGNSGYSDEVEKPLPPTPSVLDGIYDRLDNADSSISVIGGSVDALESTVSDLSGDVTGLESTVSGHSTALSNLGDDVNGLGDSVDTLEDTVSRHTGSISDLTGTVNGHTNSINSLTGDVNRIDGTVTDLTGTVNDHSNMLSRFEGGISGLENDLASFREDYNYKINNTVEMTVEYTDGTSETYNVVVK